METQQGVNPGDAPQFMIANSQNEANPAMENSGCETKPNSPESSDCETKPNCSTQGCGCETNPISAGAQGSAYQTNPISSGFSAGTTVRPQPKPTVPAAKSIAWPVQGPSDSV